MRSATGSNKRRPFLRFKAPLLTHPFPLKYSQVSFSLRLSRMCATIHLYMKHSETAEQVRIWFQTEVRKLWPVALGSLSLRKSPCIRDHCQLCESGQGHSSFALYGRKGNRRFAVYVPEDLTEDVGKAIHNGRAFQRLLSEAGRRYTLARKSERSSRVRK